LLLLLLLLLLVHLLLVLLLLPWELSCCTVKSAVEQPGGDHTQANM
jgi:hypothetical protein